VDFKGSIISLPFKDYKSNSVHKPNGMCKLVAEDNLDTNNKVIESASKRETGVR